MTAVGIAIPLFWVSMVAAFVFLFVGVLSLVFAFVTPEKLEESSFYSILPRVVQKPMSELEVAQLKQLDFDQQIKSCAEMILVWTDEMKNIKANSSLIFSDDKLRDLLRDDADKLHLAMNYLEERGLAKRFSPGYWKIR